MTRARSHYIWTVPPVGEYVGGRTEGTHEDGATFSATWSGIYLGVVRSDHTGGPMHLFVRGQINGHPQACFSHPAGAPETGVVLRSSTAVVNEWELARDPSVGVVFYADLDGERYPADGYLEDTTAACGLLIRDQAEAFETMLGAADAVGLECRVASLYRVEAGVEGAVLVMTHTRAPAEGERQILVHLNVTLGPADARSTAESIEAEIMDALSRGLDRTLDVTCTLSEEA